MNKQNDGNNEGISAGDVIYGYVVKRILPLDDIKSLFYELEHSATGARHVHISNDDKENTFGVAFKTVPSDSTGVAHILEHTALCGSKKFPVRDPFFSMIKRSLNTFMNAFTASDWTMYPFSTQNRKDFYNLMEVYLDAAFYPLLDELSFRQEGHRLEIEDGGNTDGFKLVYKGIVYNEMKGAMSSPEQVLHRSILNALYPLTTYRFNSGGDPSVIPELTYDDLKKFHGRHYHPSNAYFYTYGNLPLRDTLSFINDKVLRNFKRIDPGTEVPSHPRWNEPITCRYCYPLAKNEDPIKKNQICLAWLTPEITDSFEVLVLALLEHILLGNSASPLRKALIDSGLGSSLCDSAGYDPGNRDTMFVCGLKDVKEEDAGEIKRIIFGVLSELSEKGIEKELIESALHQIEFHRKEVTNTPYPYGIKLLTAFAGSWLHGGDPARILDFDSDLERLRREISKGPLFENKIREYFTNNQHRVLLTLAPDQDMEQKESERVAFELEKILKGLTDDSIEKIKNDSRKLEAMQDKKEELSCLPTLEISDIPPSVQSVEESSSYGAVPVACYEQATGGILYFTAASGTGNLDAGLLPLVPFFCYSFSKTGTSSRNYSEMARRIDAYTGGISLSANARTGFGRSGSCIPFVSFGGKCLARNIGMMFDIISELLLKHDFSDLTRLKNLILEYRAGLESMVVPGGHMLALSLASRNFSKTSALSEKWNGIGQLQYIKGLTGDLSEENLKRIAQNLGRISSQIIARRNLKAAVIGDKSALTEALPLVLSLQEGISSEGHDGFTLKNVSSDDGLPREGWSTSTSVSFVAYVFDAVRLEHEDAPLLAVISKLIKSMYLHREIREKGGAYGGFSIYNPEEGLFSYASYRDPHIVNTLKIYEEAPYFMRPENIRDEDVKEAVLQVCSETDRPDPPGPAARKAFYRKIVNLSDELRTAFKSGVLSVTRDKVIDAAGRYLAGKNNRCGIAVISGEDNLKSANEELAGSPLKLFRI
jgi:presequence protease